LAADPRLIERPLVMTDSRAAIGRPPEAVLALLDPRPSYPVTGPRG
ncbi:MAG: ArsC/Spx/MgsR family protein, partial [Paracoccaceae bacterium]